MWNSIYSVHSNLRIIIEGVNMETINAIIIIVLIICAIISSYLVAKYINSITGY